MHVCWNNSATSLTSFSNVVNSSTLNMPVRWPAHHSSLSANFFCRWKQQGWLSKKRLPVHVVYGIAALVVVAKACNYTYAKVKLKRGGEIDAMAIHQTTDHKPHCHRLILRQWWACMYVVLPPPMLYWFQWSFYRHSTRDCVNKGWHQKVLRQQTMFRWSMAQSWSTMFTNVGHYHMYNQCNSGQLACQLAAIYVSRASNVYLCGLVTWNLAVAYICLL